MSRITALFTRVRDSLSDQAKDRWSDDRLLRLLDEAHKDVAHQTKLLKGQYTIPLIPGQANYTLPDDVWLITRASFEAHVIPLLSHTHLDRQDFIDYIDTTNVEHYYGERGSSQSTFETFSWEVDTGSRICALVYDKRNTQDIRVYPIPNEGISDVSYDFDNAAELEFVGDELLGVVTAIGDYTFSSEFGVVTDLMDPAIESETFNTVFGVTTDILETSVSLYIQYIKTPNTITSFDDEILLAPMWDTALKFYIVGHALRDDIDAKNRQFGAETLALYARELEVAEETENSDSTRGANTHRSGYLSAFE